MPSFSVYGIGTILVDHQVFLPAFPEPDTKIEITKDRFQVGGPVPTALCLLQNFGVATHFQGQWGNDSFGQMIEDNLSESQIPFTAPQQRPNAQTGFAHVWVEEPTGRRTNAAFRGSHELDAADIDASHLKHHQALHLDGYHGDAAIKAARIVQEQGGKVFVDLGSPKPHLEQLLAHVDVLSCPERLIKRLFGNISIEEGARRLMAMGPNEIIVTRGPQGAISLSSDQPESIQQPAFPVQAADTNGAGDVFVGALIYATLLNYSAKERLRFAAAAAALKCTRTGNREALPSLASIKALLG